MIWVIISLLQDIEACDGSVMTEFITWCEESFLFLNVQKTNDMNIDFRKKASPQDPIIMGHSVEFVDGL